MKFLVKSQLDMRFADGTSYQLTPGIHDDLPENVQSHWAFSSCAQKISDSEAAKNAGGSDDTTITELQDKNSGLLLQVKTLTDSNTTLTEAQIERDKTITELQQKVMDKDTTITELQEALATLKAATASGDVADVKKSKPADSK